MCFKKIDPYDYKTWEGYRIMKRTDKYIDRYSEKYLDALNHDIQIVFAGYDIFLYNCAFHWEVEGDNKMNTIVNPSKKFIKSLCSQYCILTDVRGAEIKKENELREKKIPFNEEI